MRWLGAAFLAALAVVGVKLVPGTAEKSLMRASAPVVTAAGSRATETGALHALSDDGLLVLTAHGTQTFQTSDRTEWREGARVIRPEDVPGYRGNSIKVRYHLAGGQRIAEHVVISPERTTPGRLAAYDAAGRVLSLTTPSGTRRFTLNGETWCRVGEHVVLPENLPEYTGRSTMVTTSTRTGQVIAIRVSP